MSNTTFLNTVKPESGKEITFDGATIVADNVKVIEIPSANTDLITKQYFENNRAVSQINTLLGESSYEIQNSDLTNYSKLVISANPYTGNQIYTLPPLDVNQGKIVRVHTRTLGGKVTIQGQAGAKIGGYSSLALQSENNFLEVIAGREWEILGYNTIYDTGWVYTTNTSNRHFGTSAFDFDNRSAPFIIGERIIEATSENTGIIQSMTNDSSGTIYVKNITGSGIWTNNRQITGLVSGSTCDVDEPSGNNVNQDTYILHDFNLSMLNIQKTFYWTESKEEADFYEIGQYESNLGSFQGWTWYGIDYNNIKFQTGNWTNGIRAIADNGGDHSLGTGYHKMILEVKI